MLLTKVMHNYTGTAFPKNIPVGFTQAEKVSPIEKTPSDCPLNTSVMLYLFPLLKPR